MTILVAGATGLAGSAIIRELNRIGKPVVGISSKDIDLRDRTLTFEYLKKLKPQVVIDAAAKVGGINANNTFPVEFLSTNIQIQTNLMDASHSSGVERFIFLGSNCIYPKNCLQPIKEEYILSGPLEPTNSAYAVAKLAGIELIKSYRKEFGHKWFSIIPINLYGPNDNYNLETSHFFPALFSKIFIAKKKKLKNIVIWGSGKPKRELMYVDDLADACIYFLNKKTKESLINVGSGYDLRIIDIAKFILKKLNIKCQIFFDRSKSDGTPRKIIDSSIAKKYGWFPKINLNDGFDLTLNSYKKNKN